MSTRQKLLVILTLVCFFGTSAFAGITEVKKAYKSKDYTAAISEANKVIADTNASVSDKAEAQRHIASCYYSQQQYDKAIPEYQKVISDYPEEKSRCATAQRYIASCYYSQRQYDKAVSEYQKVISNYPKESWECAAAQTDIGNCYSRLKQYDKAIPEFQKVVDIYSNALLCARAQSSIGYSYYAQKQYDKAIPEFQKVISNYSEETYNRPQCATAQCYIGNCYYEQKQDDKAQEAYLKVLTDYPAEVSQVKTALKRVDLALMADEETTKIFAKLLRRIPATEANAELLGKLKNEFEKRAGSTGTSGYALNPDVRGCWDFDEQPEASLPDKSGEGNNGIVHGPVSRVQGRHTGAFRFNGTDTWVEIPFSPTLAPKESMVIDVWLRPETVDGRQTIIARYEEENNRRSFRLSIQDGQVVFDYSGSGRSDYLGKGGGLRSEQRLVAGQWNHVVLSYGGRFFSFLINGRTDRAFAGMPNPYHASVPGICQAGAPLQIGRHFDGREGRDYYRGDIDSIRITMPEFPAAPTQSAWERTPLAEDALNNLVRRLLEKDAPGAGAYEFNNPAAGWVFFAVTGLTDGNEQARLRLGELHGEIVLNAENRWEAMRRLPADKYHVELALAADRIPERLIVHRVPELLYTKYTGTPDWEWHKRHVLHSVNICVSRAEILSRIRRLHDPLPIVPRPPLNHEPIKEVVEWVNSGREWLVQRTSVKAPWFGLTYLDSYRKWRPSYEDPYSGAIIDEIASGYDYEKLQHWTTVINRLKREFPDKRTYIWAGGFEQCTTNNIFFNALFENSGYVVYERYLATQSTEEDAWKQIHRLFVEPMRQAGWPFPGIQRQMIWSPSTWSGPHVTEDVNPDVDYKVFLDMQFHTLATHPVFRDLAGIAPWGFDLADREIKRWVGTLYRHYGIEGHTDRLSELYGYSYKLAHLENPGFEKGMQGLDVVAAEPGSVAIGEVTAEMRPAVYRVGSRGKKYLWMKRSARMPNRVRQQVRNLRPGEYYAIKLYTADLGDMAAVLKTPHAVSINVSDGKIIAEESFRNIVRSRSAREQKPMYLSEFFIAFRAEGKTAKLEITDWADEKNPGGPVGQRLSLDFLQVKPLFMGVDGKT